MGTNFYYKIPLKKRQIKELRDKITADVDNLDEVVDACQELMKSNMIHLGKRSAGWQFLWDVHNNEYYGNTIPSIKQFLKTGGGQIVDEYGEEFSIDEFFEDEIGASLYCDENHCNSITYAVAHPEEHSYYQPGYYEFESEDGLRISKNEDFA